MPDKRERRPWQGTAATSPDAIREQIRERYANPWELFELRAETFYMELPTPAERAAFVAEFPSEFLEAFRFFARTFPPEPAEVEYGFDVFQRTAEFFEEHFEAISRFEVPDLRTVARGDFEADWYTALVVARGLWWKAEGLPLTAREEKWLRRHRKPKGNERKSDGRNETN